MGHGREESQDTDKGQWASKEVEGRVSRRRNRPGTREGGGKVYFSVVIVCTH